ncbi:membrane protein insertase YidC [Fictibacillus sp. UD]|uniref:membrane protein insertase YidC n=1 Tax=Fictibacillus sp. UD TaxID=3038777 RepID=UPI003745998B
MSIFEFIVFPFSQLLHVVADLFNGSYGLAVITITLGLRIILFPLFIKQAKQQKETNHKLELIKPELEGLKEKYRDRKKPEEIKKHQEEMVQLYGKYKINPFSTGCLPMLIQLPIVMGMYWAVIELAKVSNHYFLMFNFTETSIVLALIAGFIYYFQGKSSQFTTSTSSPINMKWMMLISPIVIFMVSISSPAILPFYWSVNGVLLIVQNIIIKSMV